MFRSSSTADAASAVPLKVGVSSFVTLSVLDAPVSEPAATLKTCSPGRIGPAAAQATQIRNRVERNLTGKVQFVDNLGDSLNGAAGDALYAETLPPKDYFATRPYGPSGQLTLANLEAVVTGAAAHGGG